MTKSILLLSIVVLLALNMNSLYAASDDVSIEVLESSQSRTVIKFQVNDFKKNLVDIQDGKFYEISCSNTAHVISKGDPELPRICRSIIIPDNSKMNLTVLQSSYTDYKDMPIIPSKGDILSGIDPATIPYEFGDIYGEDAWFPHDLTTLGEPYIFRDFRGIVVELNAFQYNPAIKTLRVYNSVTVEITSAGAGEINVFDRIYDKSVIGEYNLIYSNHFLNYDSFKDRYNPVGETGELLIICYDGFYNEMLPFMEWKRQKGIPTTMIKVTDLIGYHEGVRGDESDSDDRGILGRCCLGDANGTYCEMLMEANCQAQGGTWYQGEDCTDPCPPVIPPVTSDDIMSFIQDYYDDPSHNLAFVLLVGDYDFVKSPLHTAEPYHTFPADPLYCLVNGSDYYPDIIIGRFSAEEDADVVTQVERSIQYERDIQTDADWLQQGVGIAIDFREEYMDSLSDSLTNYTYESITPLYGPTVTPNDISNEINAGRGLVNYVGHGSAEGWCMDYHDLACYSQFPKSYVELLSNEYELPFVFSVACETGDFQFDCFGEWWLRARRKFPPTGNPVGAIGTYMPSISIYQGYGEEAQREFVRLLVNQEKSSLGGLCCNAISKMYEYFDESYHSEKTLISYTFFGDPTLVFRTSDPLPVTLSHSKDFYYTDRRYYVDVGYEGALCAISDEGVLYEKGISGTDGLAAIQIHGPILSHDSVLLTVTGLNYVTAQDSVNISYGVYLDHDPLQNTVNCIENPIDPNGYHIHCEVYSDDDLLPNEPTFVYQINDETELTMGFMSPTEEEYIYEAYIPLQTAGTTITYMISASSQEASYTTDPNIFYAIDYSVSLACEVDTLSNVYNEPVWFDYTLTNSGILDDSYELSAECAWNLEFYDAVTMDQITSTPVISKDETYNFRVMVTVGSVTSGYTIPAYLTATSAANSSISTIDTAWISSDGEALELPFSDYFDTQQLDSDRWNYNWQFVITDDAYYDIDPVHPQPYSACLCKKRGFSQYDTEIYHYPLISQYVNLSNQSANYKLTYWYERTGSMDSPEDGDDLLVEYMDAQDQWHELERQLGSGPDMLAFDSSQVIIPAQGKHSRFKLRISSLAEADPGDPTGASARFDDWYVDNIELVGISTVPVLIEPVSGTGDQNGAPTMRWHSVPNALYYEFIIDNNEDFSSPHVVQEVSDTFWTISPTLGIGTYYWKVRGAFGEFEEMGDWSETWTYIKTAPPPPPSCPVLFVSNGDEYIMENPLLTACEKSNYSESVTDYYHITKDVFPDKTNPQFKLCEMEDEVTYLYGLELVTVDHMPSSQVAVSVDGQISLYDHGRSPVSAVDDQGVDRLAEVLSKDGKSFSSSEAGYLVLGFEAMDDREMTICMSSIPKRKNCEIRIPKQSADGEPQDSYDHLKVEYLDNAENWTEFSTVPMREKATDEYVSINGKIPQHEGLIKIRLSWCNGYSTDQIECIMPSNEAAAINRYGMSTYSLKINNDAGDKFTGLDGVNPLILNKGESIEFAFTTNPINSSEVQRDYIIKAIGRYEPILKSAEDQIISEFKLYDNFPNPFNPNTTISFDMPQPGHVTIEIINLLGQQVTVLVDQRLDAGHHEIEWNGCDKSGNSVASGVYFYRLQTDEITRTKKMILMK